MKKRLMAIALSLVMALSFLPVGAGAAEAGEETGFYAKMCGMTQDGEFAESEWPETALSGVVNSRNTCRFYLDGAPLDVTSVTSSDETVVTVAQTALGTARTPCWSIQYNKLGTATLTVTANEVSYTIPATAVLGMPRFDLYAKQSTAEADKLGWRLNYYDLGEKAVWLMSEGGFTKEQYDALTVINGEKTQVERENSQNCDVKITLAEPASRDGYKLAIYNDTEPNQEYPMREIYIYGAMSPDIHELTVGGDEYAIGFGTASTTLGTVQINEYDLVEPSIGASDQYAPWTRLSVVAGKKAVHTEDNTQYYVLDANQPFDIKIQKMGLTAVKGDMEALSWSQESHVPETTTIEPAPEGEVGDGAWIYQKAGLTGYINIWAEVLITHDNGAEETVTVSCPVDIFYYAPSTGDTEVTRPNNDTLESLQEYLNDLATKVDENAVGVHVVNLGNTTYHGILHIPDVFQNLSVLQLHGVIEGNTTFKGGIDTNGAHKINIDFAYFEADDTLVAAGEPTRAIFSNAANAHSTHKYTGYTTYSGYDIAVDASKEMVDVRDSRFINNGVALKIDLAGTVKSNDFDDHLYGNVFVNNKTAIQLVSFAEGMQPYKFLVYWTSFIDNGTDFDVEEQGNFYFYRCYFGKNHKEYNDYMTGILADFAAAKTEEEYTAFLTRCPAKIKADAAVTTVTANPCWKYPYSPMLVSDWENGTKIINAQSDELKLDASAFDADGVKVIDVVDVKDAEETALGTWTFGEGGNA